jgi:hypothetical protein
MITLVVAIKRNLGKRFMFIDSLALIQALSTNLYPIEACSETQWFSITSSHSKDRLSLPISLVKLSVQVSWPMLSTSRICKKGVRLREQL